VRKSNENSKKDGAIQENQNYSGASPAKISDRQIAGAFKEEFVHCHEK